VESLVFISYLGAMLLTIVGAVIRKSGKIYDLYQNYLNSVTNKLSSVEMVKASLSSIRQLLKEQIQPRDNKEKEELIAYLNVLEDLCNRENVSEIRIILKSLSLPDWISIYPKKPYCKTVGFILLILAIPVITIPFWVWGFTSIGF